MRNEYQLRQIAKELITNPGQSYAEIAEKVGINTARPAINLYQTINTDRFKCIMEEIKPKIYDIQELKETVTEILRKGKNSEKLKAAELGMREKAMLVDKTEQITKPNVNDLSNISTDDIQAELIKRLRIGQEGVFKPAKNDIKA